MGDQCYRTRRRYRSRTGCAPTRTLDATRTPVSLQEPTLWATNATGRGVDTGRAQGALLHERWTLREHPFPCRSPPCGRPMLPDAASMPVAHRVRSYTNRYANTRFLVGAHPVGDRKRRNVAFAHVAHRVRSYTTTGNVGSLSRGTSARNGACRSLSDNDGVAIGQSIASAASFQRIAASQAR